MIIVMKAKAKKEELEEVVKKIEKLGYKPHIIQGVERSVIGAVGDERGKAKLQSLEVLSGVEKVVPILKPYKLASRDIKPEGTIVNINGKVEIGGNKIVVIAGPCSVESEDQIIESAHIVKEAGADILRGGAFKPRTSPYSFQGLEKKGLILLAKAREKVGLPVVTEITNPKDVDLVAEYSDILQVGARNVQNFALLKKLGRSNKPILLKRGMSSTVEEFLMSAEYILSEGNKDVILCERGIRTFETATRNTLDLSCIPVLKERTHLPIIVDPSHATGFWSYVAPMSYAAIAAGADGLMIEVHDTPARALSDGAQSLPCAQFTRLMKNVRRWGKVSGKEWG